MTLMSAIADRLLVASTNSNVKLRAEPGSGSVDSSLASDLRRASLYFLASLRAHRALALAMRRCVRLCVRAEKLRSEVVYLRDLRDLRRRHHHMLVSVGSHREHHGEH